MRVTSRRSLVAALGCLLLAIQATGAPDLAEAKPEKEKKERDRKPRLSLSVDTAVGFTPVTATLTANLTGVEPQDANFCHPSVTWIRIDPGQTEDAGLRITEDAVCRHAPEESSATTSFLKTFVLYQPGSYLVRLVVQGKDGTRVESAYTRIQVLRVQ
jgi:hypothetical protein